MVTQIVAAPGVMNGDSNFPIKERKFHIIAIYATNSTHVNSLAVAMADVAGVRLRLEKAVNSNAFLKTYPRGCSEKPRVGELGPILRMYSWPLIVSIG